MPANEAKGPAEGQEMNDKTDQPPGQPTGRQTGPQSGTPVAELSFEEALAELERVVDALERGDVPLERSIDLYERGEALRVVCEKRLKDAQMRVDKIVAGPDGEAKSEPSPSTSRAGAATTFRSDRRRLTSARSFGEHLQGVAGEVEGLLDRLLAPGRAPGRDLAPGEARLWEAMAYATLGGGKRLRAFLAVESAAIFDVDRGAALRAGAAAECLHAYSLVHDDLPCMDDDDLRRGKPTAHRAFDEATAVLAGDALQTLAFEILADPATHAEPAVRAELCLGLARAAGAPGMVGGQAVDIAAETAAEPFDLATITRLQALKTGALIRFSAEAGAILGQDKDARMRLADYAGHLGLAFQIRDDLLDVEGDPQAVGKGVRKDAGAGKATFVSLLGVEGARRAAADEVGAATAALAPFGPAARWLREAAEFAIQRAN